MTDLRANPKVFVMANDLARHQDRDSARYRALDLNRGLAWDAAWRATCDGLVVWRTSAYNAIAALIAYDDSAKYLNWSYEKLKVWVELSENPAAVLLLPYVWAKEQLKEPA